MSHTCGNGNISGNNYLNKKRHEDDIPMDNRYHYDKYEKLYKYGNHGRYNNMKNYMHSRPPQGNNFYNSSSNSRYRENYYNNPKLFHSNNYSNKLGFKRDYKKPHQKYTNQNSNEGIRNLSYCDMPSPSSSSSMSLKSKPDRHPLKGISSPTTVDSKSNSNKSMNSNNGININEINKFVSNITNIPIGRGQSIFNQQNINIAIKLASPSNLKYKDKKNSDYKGENKKWGKDGQYNKEEEISTFKFPKPSEKLLNYQQFNRNSIKIEENPLQNFDIYPKNLFEFNLHGNSRKIYNTKMTNRNLENALSIKSCYLLAKIKNWRLVTNFVPVSSLTEEAFQNIIPLEEKINDAQNKEKEKEPEKVEGKKKERKNKSYLVYSDKYEEVVEKALEQIMQKKKKVNKDIFNKRYIISQYKYDILKLKNKIKQNNFIINYLNIKQDNLQKVLDGNTKE